MENFIHGFDSWNDGLLLILILIRLRKYALAAQKEGFKVNDFGVLD